MMQPACSAATRVERDSGPDGDVDADATWLIDYHEIHLVLIANPHAGRGRGAQALEEARARRRDEVLGVGDRVGAEHQHGDRRYYRMVIAFEERLLTVLHSGGFSGAGVRVHHPASVAWLDMLAVRAEAMKSGRFDPDAVGDTQFESMLEIEEIDRSSWPNGRPFILIRTEHEERCCYDRTDAARPQHAGVVILTGRRAVGTWHEWYVIDQLQKSLVAASD